MAPYILFILISLIVPVIAGIIWLRYIFRDTRIPLIHTFCSEGAGKRAMFIFAHPDDETTCAGTICRLKQLGFEIMLLTMTTGEAHNKELRLEELRKSEKVLGIDHLLTGHFPNNSWEAVEKGELIAWNETGKSEIRSWMETVIMEFRPSVIFSYDRNAGGYGHPEHIMCSQIIYEICTGLNRKNEFRIERFYELTLPVRLEKMMLGNVPVYQAVKKKNGGRGLPSPDVSLEITPYAREKKQAILSHASQKAILNRLFPCIYYIPAAVYFRIWDREYFSVNYFDDTIQRPENR